MNAQQLVAPVPVLTDLDAEALAAADHVVVFPRSTARSPIPAVVIELRDAYGNLLARTVVETDARRETVAERMLDAVDLARCSAFVTDPLARHRVIASVGPRARASVERLERARVGA